MRSIERASSAKTCCGLRAQVELIAMTEILLNVRDRAESALRHLHFLGYSACAFKHTFRDGLDKVLEDYRRATGISLNCHVPLGCGSGDEYDSVWKASCIEDFPDVVASLGFGDFFRKEFVERFMAKGFFKSAWDGPLNRIFEDAGFRDPDGWYTVYSVMPYVMLVDKKRLGDTPVPKQWSDLLGPQFRGRIIINGTGDKVAEVPLLYFYKEHGEEGLSRLAANVSAAWHSAQMAKAAGSADLSGAAVYIIPWFFASVCRRKEAVSVVWPEDGAFTSPLYLLAKKEKYEDLAPVIDYVTGAELGRKSAHSCLPSLNPLVDVNLPEGASFKWLGWDYVKSHDVAELKDQAHELFIAEWKKQRRRNAES